MNMNMNKQPGRWVTVLDADSGKPVPGVPLVYTSIRKPYFIVGAVMISRKYVTDADGKAHVPSGVYMRTYPGCAYVDVRPPIDGRKNQDPIKAKTIYVKPYERHMKELRETEQEN